MNLLTLLVFITAALVYKKHAVTGEAESPIDIYKSVTIERVDLKTTHEEADNILAHQTVAAALENRKEFWLFQMILMYSLYCFVIIKPKTSQKPVVMQSLIKERAEIDTRQTVQRSSNIVPDLICCTCSIRM